MGITQERLQESLAECPAALGRERDASAVAGAFAVAMRGHVRANRDIDFIVRRVDRVAARRALEGVGYVCTRQGDAFAHFERRPTPDMPGVVERADLLSSPHAVGQQVIEAAMRQPLSCARGPLPVVPIEALLLMELMALGAAPSRPNDRSLVLELWRLHRASFDVEHLRADASAIGDGVLFLLDALLISPAVREFAAPDERWHRGLWPLHAASSRRHGATARRVHRGWRLVHNCRPVGRAASARGCAGPRAGRQVPFGGRRSFA